MKPFEAAVLSFLAIYAVGMTILYFDLIQSYATNVFIFAHQDESGWLVFYLAVVVFSLVTALGRFAISRK